MSVRKKFKMAGSKPKKMACGGRVKMQTGGQTNTDPTKSRRVLPDGTVIYIDPKTGRKIGGGTGSGPTNRGKTGLEDARQQERDRKAGVKQASTGKSARGVSKGSLKKTIGNLTKATYKAAVKAKKKAAADKKRGIKYIR